MKKTILTIIFFVSLVIFTESYSVTINNVKTSLNSSDIDSLRAAELIRHNVHRSKHVNTSNLTISSYLNSKAQAYADYLQSNLILTHSN